MDLVLRPTQGAHDDAGCCPGMMLSSGRKPTDMTNPTAIRIAVIAVIS